MRLDELETELATPEAEAGSEGSEGAWVLRGGATGADLAERLARGGGAGGERGPGEAMRVMTVVRLLTRMTCGNECMHVSI